MFLVSSSPLGDLGRALVVEAETPGFSTGASCPSSSISQPCGLGHDTSLFYLECLDTGIVMVTMPRCHQGRELLASPEHPHLGLTKAAPWSACCL